MLPLFSLSFSPTEEASKPKQPPTFAKDFYVGLQTNLGINQGGYRLPSGDVWCTHPFAPSASTSPDPLSAPLRGGEVLSRLSTRAHPTPKPLCGGAQLQRLDKPAVQGAVHQPGLRPPRAGQHEPHARGLAAGRHRDVVRLRAQADGARPGRGWKPSIPSSPGPRPPAP